jgi:hypothetical protein
VFSSDYFESCTAALVFALWMVKVPQCSKLGQDRRFTQGSNAYVAPYVSLVLDDR